MAISIVDWDHRLPSSNLILRVYGYYSEDTLEAGYEAFDDRLTRGQEMHALKLALGECASCAMCSIAWNATTQRNLRDCLNSRPGDSAGERTALFTLANVQLTFRNAAWTNRIVRDKLPQ